jgi:hypothetical protein
VAGFGDVGRVGVRAVLGGERDPFERPGRAWAEQCRRCALGRAGQKRALAQIHARVEIQNRLPAQPPQPHHRRQRDDRDEDTRTGGPHSRGASRHIDAARHPLGRQRIPHWAVCPYRPSLWRYRTAHRFVLAELFLHCQTLGAGCLRASPLRGCPTCIATPRGLPVCTTVSAERGGPRAVRHVYLARYRAKSRRDGAAPGRPRAAR